MVVLYSNTVSTYFLGKNERPSRLNFVDFVVIYVILKCEILTFMIPVILGLNVKPIISVFMKNEHKGRRETSNKGMKEDSQGRKGRIQ